MKRLLLAFSIVAALWSAACNGSNSIVTPPPPVGKYSAASLQGQYAFSTFGEVITSGAAGPISLARVGSFTADGMGNIQTGVEDVNSLGATGLAIQITGGSYTVGADGRGTLTLALVSGGVPSSLNFGITLTSTNDGLMIDETSTTTQASTGSGNFIKQTNADFSLSSILGSYVFDFSGFDGSQAPESIVGEFTGSGGPINSGVQDVNDAGTLTPAEGVAGNFAIDGLNPSTLTSFGRGIAQINGIQFAYYIVDGTRIRLLSTSGGTMLTGDSVLQDNTVPTTVASINSSFVFLVAGSSGSGGISRLTRFTASGAAVSNVLQDTNNGGQFILTNTGNNASIGLDPVNVGRGTLTFTDPNFPKSPGTYVFYLSSANQGVIQETTLVGGTTTANDVADGTIAAQIGSPFSSSNFTGTYALNWSGESLQGGITDEEDMLGEVTVSSLNLTGAADIFQFQGGTGVPATDTVASGSIVIKGDGTESTGSSSRNTMSVKLTQTNSLNVDCVVYFASPQLAFFANNQDPNRTVVGALQAQQ